jgi:hypothetical protein
MGVEIVSQRFDHHSLARGNRSKEFEFITQESASIGVGKQASLVSDQGCDGVKVLYG